MDLRFRRWPYSSSACRLEALQIGAAESADVAHVAATRLEPEEDQVLFVWQVLLHVVKHATDHRAQILRALNDLGVETSYQDYIFYVYENLI